MQVAATIIPNLYRDSVSLLQLSARISSLPGITRASAVMATPANLALLGEAGLLKGNPAARSNDLLIVIEGADDGAISDAMAEVQAVLRQSRSASTAGGSARNIAPKSIEMGREDMPEANLALISTPGEYAAAEAMKALRLGLHVMLFSDNVAIPEEIALKQWARVHDLIVMGPDCGTAIINGIPLGFANKVRRGPIGVVAASGTGLQQVTCLVDRAQLGISQAIGTGGHDLKAEVGGITMLQGLAALADDPQTKVIVLISKPPSPDIARKVCEAAEKTSKPVVVNFLGADPNIARAHQKLHFAETLEDAAASAVALVRGQVPAGSGKKSSPTFEFMDQEKANLSPGQRYLRGLYSGGTFCYEALLLLSKTIGPVWSTTPLDRNYALEDVWNSREHTVIDLGDDFFTRGRAHPMIDQRLRNERIIKEASDPETAVILFDVVLGYGSHMDPATEIAAVIKQGRAHAAKQNRYVSFVASVCGTSDDPQNLDRQEAALREVGVHVAQSNAEAVRAAAQFITARTDHNSNAPGDASRIPSLSNARSRS